MSTSETTQHVEVDVPVEVAYRQWTNFEEFPNFMTGVSEVKRLGGDKLHFEVEVGPKNVSYDAEIVDQTPNETVSWRATDGKTNIGVVSFTKIDANQTRVGLRLQYEVEGLAEHVGDTLGFVSRQAKSDLHNFKNYVEDRTKAIYAWDGRV